MGKRTAVDVGTRLVKKVLTQKAPAVSQRVVATKVQNILNKYVEPQAPVRQNINSLIDGSGNNAVAIHSKK